MFKENENASIGSVHETGDEQVTEILPGTTTDEDLYDQLEDVLGRLNAPL
jgi:hypothetical protein